MPTFHIFWTLLLMIIFVGIFFWAWSGKRKSDFEEASRLPLDQDSIHINPSEKEADHG